MIANKDAVKSIWLREVGRGRLERVHHTYETALRDGNLSRPLSAPSSTGQRGLWTSTCRVISPLYMVVGDCH